MKKNIIKTFFATAMVVATILTTGISVQAAEAPAAQTQTIKQTLNKAVIAKVFDAAYYAATYPDVVAVLGNDPAVLLNHYVTSGVKEGRDASATFNASVYAIANPDLIMIYGDNLEGYIEHYATFGINENRVSSTSDYVKMAPATRAAVVAQTSQVVETSAPSFTETIMGYVSPVQAATNAEQSTDFATAYNAWITRLGGDPNYVHDLGNGNSFTNADWAKQEAYANQGIYYNTITKETQAYGTYKATDNYTPYGEQISTYVSSTGVVKDVIVGVTQEQFVSGVEEAGGTVWDSSMDDGNWE